MRIFRKLVALVFISLLLNMISIPILLKADTLPDINIVAIDKEDQYTKKFDAVVQVKFNNSRLYNEKVYLSYHVLDNNNNIIFFEGKREILTPLQEGLYFANVTIDLSVIKELKDVKEAKISFDLIDEKNVYWFSQKTDLKMQTDSIYFKLDRYKAFTKGFLGAIEKRPVIFFVNIAFFVVFIYSSIIIKTRMYK